MTSVLKALNTEISDFSASTQDKDAFLMKNNEILSLLEDLVNQLDDLTLEETNEKFGIIEQKMNELSASWASFKEDSASGYLSLCCNNFYASNCFQNQLY
jgi:predicted translin family RNA/ssDNA-binding protein